MEKTQKNTIDKVKLFKTILLILFMFYQGMFINGFYGTLLDFTEILHSSIDIVSLGLSLRCLGSCIGCFTGAIVFNHCERFMACATFLTVEGIAAVLITTSHYLIIYYVCLFVIGLSTGAVETGLYVIVADLWKDKRKPFIQTIDFVDVISMIVAPLFVRPFLSHEEPFDDFEFSAHDQLHTNESITNNNYNTTNLVEAHKKPSHIWIPFTVIGLMMVSSSLLASLLHCYAMKHGEEGTNCEENKSEKSDTENKDKQKENEKEVEKKENSCSLMKEEEHQIERKYEIAVTIICCLMIFFGNAMVLMFSQFWPVFVVFIELQFSKSQGLLMFSALCGVMAITSFFSLLIAIKLRPFYMIMIYLTLLLTGDIVLLTFASNSATFLWIGAILVCSGLGNYFATVFNLMSEKMKVTNFIGSLFVFSAYMSTASGFPFLIGRYIEEFPMILIFANLILISIVMFLCVVLNQCDVWKRRRLAKHKNELRVITQSVKRLSN